jgi:hypothetical protein
VSIADPTQSASTTITLIANTTSSINISPSLVPLGRSASPPVLSHALGIPAAGTNPRETALSYTTPWCIHGLRKIEMAAIRNAPPANAACRHARDEDTPDGSRGNSAVRRIHSVQYS